MDIFNIVPDIPSTSFSYVIPIIALVVVILILLIIGIWILYSYQQKVITPEPPPILSDEEKQQKLALLQEQIHTESSSFNADELLKDTKIQEIETVEKK